MRIKEVSEQTGISIYTLRYYEKIGLLYRIQKDKSGNRNYTAEDISRIGFIKCMREADISIETLKEYINLYDTQTDTFFERQKLLRREYEAMRDKYLRLEAGMRTLEKKAELLADDVLDTKLRENQE